jgi:3-hydroxybutyryl-CoA dehydratase
MLKFMPLNKTINKKATALKYQDVRVGDIYEFEREITGTDVYDFAELTGDFNPLHTDKTYGEKSKLGKNIVHGMLVGSLFSTLIGMYCPGEKSLYLSQTLNFRQPVFPNDKVKVKGEVVGKNDSVKIVTIKTEIFRDNILIISGEAKASFLE